MARAGEGALLAGLAGPFVVILLILISLPTVGGVLRRFRLSDEEERNHALEHGTIHFLRQKYGKRYKLSGRADVQGFRVAGARSESDIQKAFARLLQEIRAGNTDIVVKRGCGSNMVTAQAIGLLLLTVLAVAVIIAAPPVSMVLAAVVVILLVALPLRYPLGMRIQSRRFLLVDFDDASILGISPVSRAELLERHPVFFVRTGVQVKQPSNQRRPAGNRA
ncbi:MAG: DUF6391 domain-containing protein [Candidatus Polarisedimenticolia bacterium]